MQTERRYDLDWLRVAGVFLVVVFHTMMIFILEPWAVVYIKDTEYMYGFKTVSSFIHIFHMPLMFVIAGMSVKFSLQRRTAEKFLKERLEQGMAGTVILALVTQVSSLSIIFALIGTGDSYWNKNCGVLKYLSGACFPIYIIHMLVNTVVGFFVVQLSIPPFIKFMVILVLTVLISIVVYECVQYGKMIIKVICKAICKEETLCMK